LIKINVKTAINDDVERAFFQKFNALTEEIYKDMATSCASYARGNINNVTGNLEMSIKAKKSKYKDGGWICMAASGKEGKGNHAFLVEYGTEGPRKPLVKKRMRFEIDGKVIFATVVAKMPATPFMRPARDKVIAETKATLT